MTPATQQTTPLFRLQMEPRRQDPVTGRHAPRFHKECVLNGGRRLRRARRQITRWEDAVSHHRRRGHLTEAQLKVMLELPGWFNRESGQCDPSHETIAARADVCVKTVQRALAAAKRLGLIGWDQRAIRLPGETIQITNQYVLFPGMASDAVAPAIDAPPHEQPFTGDIKSISGCSDSLSPLERALASLGRAIVAKEGSTIRG